MSNAPTVHPHHYTVPVGEPGGSNTVDWRWPDNDNAVWIMAERDGSVWIEGGPLNEEGRAALLVHFELDEIAHKLPLETIQTMSPSALVSLHLENGLPVYNPRSVCLGDHFEACLAA